MAVEYEAREENRGRILSEHPREIYFDSQSHDSLLPRNGLGSVVHKVLMSTADYRVPAKGEQSASKRQTRIRS